MLVKKRLKSNWKFIFFKLIENRLLEKKRLILYSECGPNTYTLFFVANLQYLLLQLKIWILDLSTLI